ncbi:MAG: bifunctional phosphoribosylaminoimidazolecarboxamide formyltransferase/IMP cyclohydrolase [Nitriliruptoraceae bacterium]
MITPVRRALISCFDKAGIGDFAQQLAAFGVEIISTGSTAATLREAGVNVTDVSAITGFPECLDGRVKTLHPHVHAGILADRQNADHVAQIEQMGITAIDLVVVNLYPFTQTVESGAKDHEIIEMIDIGGPTMIRAAAKNLGSVGVVTGQEQYADVLGAIRMHGGLDDDLRLRLASDAFKHTAAYDAAITNWFTREERFPEQLSVALPRVSTLRYGENPHQAAAAYRMAEATGVLSATQVHGKELSYNNLLDADAAWELVCDSTEPAVAIIKHTNPAGFAVGTALSEIYDRALSGDPVSAFGGIVAVNRPLDAATAEKIIGVFTEVVIAPAIDDAALTVLTTKPNLRVLIAPSATKGEITRSLRTIGGGVLVQDLDAGDEPWDDWQVVTETPIDPAMMTDLKLAWIACKHTKSNAIVLAKDATIVGVGAGQMSRVDSVRLAVERSGDRHQGSVLASDAFFPFRDGPDAAAAAGIGAIVQPGGSVRDDEVIAAANEHGIAMVFTGRRHFRH